MKALITWKGGGQAMIQAFEGENLRVLSTTSAAPGTPLFGTLAALPPEPPAAAPLAAAADPAANPDAGEPAATPDAGEPAAAPEKPAVGTPAMAFQVKVHGCKRTAEGFVVTGRVINLTRALRVRLEKAIA